LSVLRGSLVSGGGSSVALQRASPLPSLARQPGSWVGMGCRNLVPARFSRGRMGSPRRSAPGRQSRLHDFTPALPRRPCPRRVGGAIVNRPSPSTLPRGGLLTEQPPIASAAGQRHGCSVTSFYAAIVRVVLRLPEPISHDGDERGDVEQAHDRQAVPVVPPDTPSGTGRIRRAHRPAGAKHNVPAA
jgi:hypothetical protein